MRVLKRVANIASTILVVLAVVLAVALVGVRLLGFEVYTVLSGSMEPAYGTGSVIWVEPRDASEVEVGDPITFVMNEDLDVATHRVVAIDHEVGEFTTQGDANDAPDASPVLFENLIGVPVFAVPGLGYLVNYVQTPPGCYVALIVAAAMLALLFIPDLFDGREAKRDEGPRRAASGRPAARGAISVPRGPRAQAAPAGAQAPRPATAPAPFESLSPQQRAYYAQRELERRRMVREAAARMRGGSAWSGGGAAAGGSAPPAGKGVTSGPRDYR